MNSKDTVKDIAEGTTKGFLKYSEDKIKELVHKFKEKKLRFIGEKETIEIAKETRKSGEWAFYKSYIKDNELLFIIRLGLVLRKLESNPNKLNNLKEKIKKKYEIKGLHIAYFVQNGILNRYVGILLDDLDSAEELDNKISRTLNNIEKHIIFVDWRYTERQIIQESMTVVASHKPDIFIISGILSASEIIRKCEEKLINTLNRYSLEKISTGEKEVLFFKNNE